MSIQNLFSQQRKPVVRGQNLILDNKHKCTQRFSPFDNEVYDIINQDKGFSYEDIKNNLAFDPNSVLEKKFKNSYVAYLKLLAISICKKINVSEIYDSQSAIQAITAAMNDGGVETGMLQLTPWLLETAKKVTQQYAKKRCDLLEVIEKCEEIKNAFGEGLSYCAVGQCIAAVAICNPSLKPRLLEQAGLIKTACTYHIVGKMEMGAHMSYEEALKLLITCIMQDPESFRFYGSFIKNFQNTRLHVVYKVGAELAVDGIKAIRKMQNHGNCKRFEQQLAVLGGVADFNTRFDDVVAENALMNVGCGINSKIDKFDSALSANFDNIVKGLSNKQW